MADVGDRQHLRRGTASFRAARASTRELRPNVARKRECRRLLAVGTAPAEIIAALMAKWWRGLALSRHRESPRAA